MAQRIEPFRLWPGTRAEVPLDGVGRARVHLDSHEKPLPHQTIRVLLPADAPLRFEQPALTVETSDSEPQRYAGSLSDDELAMTVSDVDVTADGSLCELIAALAPTAAAEPGNRSHVTFVVGDAMSHTLAEIVSGD